MLVGKASPRAGAVLLVGGARSWALLWMVAVSEWLVGSEGPVAAVAC